MSDRQKGLHVRAVWMEGHSEAASQDAAEFDKKPEFRRAPNYWGIYKRDNNGLLEWIADYGDREKAEDAMVASSAGLEYSWNHMDAAVCAWEHVLEQLHLKTPGPANPWDDYRKAYGMAALRDTVMRHAVQIDVEYQKAHANGYDESFDWDFVPKYMEDHITRILT
jgi:hypothetical protein